MRILIGLISACLSLLAQAQPIVVLAPNGSDTTGTGSASSPLRTLQGVRDKGLLVAGARIQLTRGGSYGALSIGPCPANLTVEAVGVGVRPVVTTVYAYAPGPGRTPGLSISGLNVIGTGPASDGLVLHNRNDLPDTGFDDARIVDVEVSNCSIGIAVEAGPGHMRRMEIRGCFFHDNGSLGILVGGVDGLTIADTVCSHNGWQSSRDRTQSHGAYIQHLNTSDVSVVNCACVDSPANSWRGCGTWMSWCLSVEAGCGFATDEQLKTMAHCVAIGSHDPKPESPSGAGINLNRCSGAELSWLLFAGGRSSANGHAIGPDACVNVTFSDAVAYDWWGDCLAISNEPSSGNSLNRVRFIQPDPAREGFLNENLPIPATWVQDPAVVMDRQRVADERATVPRLLALAGVQELVGFARWLAEDPSRISGTIAWASAPYLPAHNQPSIPDTDGDGVVTVHDFQVFQNWYAAGDPRANCDHSAIPPVLNIRDFSCFINAVAAMPNVEPGTVERIGELMASPRKRPVGDLDPKSSTGR